MMLSREFTAIHSKLDIRNSLKVNIRNKIAEPRWFPAGHANFATAKISI